MSNRRPIASPRSSALPTLVALIAAGVAVECYAGNAHAQTPPDAGVHQPPRPPHPPTPPIPPAGGIPPARPYPLQPPVPPTPPTT